MPAMLHWLNILRAGEEEELKWPKMNEGIDGKLINREYEMFLILLIWRFGNNI